MASIVENLKAQARILHRLADVGDGPALARLHRVCKGDEPVRRRHCLAAIAKELGFRGWPHAVAVLSGRPDGDFGTLLYPAACASHWNIWSADYQEAYRIRAEHGGFLLAYRRQFLIVEEHFLTSLGLDPRDPDWARIQRDWVRPGDQQAWSRLCGKAVHVRQTVHSTGTNRGGGE